MRLDASPGLLTFVTRSIGIKDVFTKVRGKVPTCVGMKQLLPDAMKCRQILLKYLGTWVFWSVERNYNRTPQTSLLWKGTPTLRLTVQMVSLNQNE